MGDNRITLNKDNAFNIMVNLYVIRYLYSHLDKADCFMVKSKRRKSKDFYKRIGISNDRMTRIFHGENFNLYMEDKEKICNMFHVKMDYFIKNGDIMKIHLVDETDWKCLFNIKYNTGFNVVLREKEIKENANHTEEKLKNLSKKGVIENEYDTQSPIFRIWYYFRNGTTYKEESRLTRFLKELSNLSISDWDELEEDLSQMQRYGDMLETHARYVKAAITYKSMKTK